MRHQDQQTHDDHPEGVSSDPVPVPPPDGDADRRDGTGNLDREYVDTVDEHGDPVTGDVLDERAAHDRDRADLDRDDDPDALDDPDRTNDPDALDDPDRTNDPDALDDPDRTNDPARIEDPDGIDDSDRIDGAPIGDLDRDDRDRTEFHEPAPAPTTFGASTVGGAAAAAALANPDPALEPDPRDERTARPGDGAAADQIDGVDEVDGVGEERTDRTPVDVNEPAVGGPSPDAVGEPTGEAAAAPTEMLPGDVPTEPVAALLADDAAQGFRDRWRDVQLRFVDDPRAAAGEAQGLVDEAIDSLTAALAAQKNDLGGWQNGESGDTEQLRVVVRRYRDFLDRLLGL